MKNYIRNKCMRDNPVIYLRSSKNFEIARKGKKCMEDKLCTGNRNSIRKNKVNTTRTTLMKQERNVKSFCLMHPYRRPPVTPNFSKESFQSYSS